MRTKKYDIPYCPKSSLEEKYFTSDHIFFDIETTGFSPVHNQLYLIGCGYREESFLHVVQFFAEDATEEACVLQAFFHLLDNFTTILSFNGLGFDIPFLKAKCSTLGMEDIFFHFDYIDLYKAVTKYRHIFNLENYKQKTIEEFLCVPRTDLCSGGDLIPVYQTYVKNPTEEALHLLLLHNHDDVLGMLPLIQLLSYEAFFGGGYSNCTVRLNDFTDSTGKHAEELIFSGDCSYAFPKKLSVKQGFLFLHLEGSSFSLSVRLYDGTLKYFYPDYKNYFYLPAEDMAIHKSVASFVEKDYRTPARAANCYLKKQGLFVPQYRELFSPAFREQYKDKISFFLLEDSFFADRSKKDAYLSHLLSQLVKSKAPVS